MDKKKQKHVRLSPLCYFANCVYAEALFDFEDWLENRCSWNFTKIIGKHMCKFIKKWFQHMCFPVNFAKFSKTPIF